MARQRDLERVHHASDDCRFDPEYRLLQAALPPRRSDAYNGIVTEDSTLVKTGDGGDAEGGCARPWRVVGATICLVLGLMFVIGVLLLDSRTAPGLYALYWSVMLVLVVWVALLAFKDVAFTLRFAKKRR